MKKSLLTLLCLMVFGLPALAEQQQIFQFKKETIEGITDDQGNTWVNNYPGFNFSSNQTPGKYGGSGANERGISTSQTGSITSDFEVSNIIKITVDASSNDTGNNLTVKIGDTQIGNTTSLSKKNHIKYVFESATPLSGKITFEITKSQKTSWIAGFEIEQGVDNGDKTLATLTWGECALTEYKIGTTAEFTLSADPAEAAEYITVTSSNPAAVSIDGADGKYTAKFIEAANNVEIIAALADNEKYAANPATLKFNVLKSATSVADFYSIGANNSAYIGFPLTVTYKNGINTYAIDNEGAATLIYGTTPDYTTGDVIPAGWSGKYSPFNGLDEIAVVITPEAATENKGYTVPEVESVSEEDINRVVILKNVKFASATASGKTKTNFEGKVGQTAYTFRNNFADVASVGAGTYDVKAAVSCYGNTSTATLQLYPIEYTPVITDTPMPVFTIAEDDWADEENGVVYKGAKLTISAPEGLTDWIMSYSVNGAEEEISEEAVTLTINEDTSITAYINDEENAITKSYTIAKLPALTLDPAIGAVEENTVVTVNCEVEGALLFGFIGEEEVENAPMPYTFTVTDQTDVTFWAEKDRYVDSETVEGTYTIKLPNFSPKWEPVNSMNQLKNGDIVTFMAKEYTSNTGAFPAVVMAGAGEKVITVTEFTYENGHLPEGTMTFTLNAGSADNTFTLCNEDNGYLYASSKNTAKFQKNPFDLSLSINENTEAVVAYSVDSLYYTLQYNPNMTNKVDLSTARFAFYSSTQKPIYMYRQSSLGLEAPNFDDPTGTIELGHEMRFTTLKGAHIWIRETDLIESEPETSRNKIVSADDGWFNHETHDVTYRVETLGKKVEVKAVSADGKTHSPVLSFYIASDGRVTTGVNSISAEEEGTVRYFNLQGVEVKNPANGVFIRVQGDKATKVAL